MDGKIKWTDDDIQITTEALTVFFGVSRRTLSNWANEGCPKLARGWWSLKDVIAWRERQGKGVDGAIDLEDDAVLKKRKLRAEIALKEIQRDYTELKKRITDGEYLEREQVTQDMKRFMVAFKRQALNIPKSVAAQIGSKVEPEEARRIERDLTVTVKRLLEGMSDGRTISKK